MSAGIAGIPIRDRLCMDRKVEQSLPSVLFRAYSMRLKAIAFRKSSVRHVFFVAETKGSMDSLTLRDIERGKIACARKLFNEFSDEDVRYDVVHSYEDLLTVIQGTE